ncbi:MAG TPA: HTH-type transcriptional repressor FabR [Stenotrophobium sp.]|jgi:AcrR family transcriptional regulator|nr:HTH-type transcriptional repressor FabR [Stenotrophobium sp.]
MAARKLPKSPGVTTKKRAARRGQVERHELIAAALKLLGPSRSVSSLSLREIARVAGIAPNSFYRHFRNVDELAVALIDQAGGTLRKIIREARNRISPERSVIRTSIETFMEQLEADEKLLHVLLREGHVGSDEFKQAVDRELQFFEEELREDLMRIAAAEKTRLVYPSLVAKAMTRLVFTMGATAMNQPAGSRGEIAEQMIKMLRIIAAGAQTLELDETAPSLVDGDKRNVQSAA